MNELAEDIARERAFKTVKYMSYAIMAMKTYDLAATLVGIKYCAGVELNPLMAKMINDPLKFTIFNILVITIMLAVPPLYAIACQNKTTERIARTAVTLLLTFYAFVSAWTTFNLLACALTCLL